MPTLLRNFKMCERMRESYTRCCTNTIAKILNLFRLLLHKALHHGRSVPTDMEKGALIGGLLRSLIPQMSQPSHYRDLAIFYLSYTMYNAHNNVHMTEEERS